MTYKIMKPRLCPGCKKQLPIGTGYSFDKDNNLICDCGKVVFPTSAEIENKMEKPTQYNYKHSIHNSNSYPYRGGTQGGAQRGVYEED
jgi:hypothetical protein